MSRLIGVASNRPGAGKDEVGTMIQYLTSQVGIKMNGVEESSPISYDLFKSLHDDIEPIWRIRKFAGKLKEAASLLTGISDWEDRDKKNNIVTGTSLTRRQYMINLGMSLRRSISPDIWVNSLFDDYKTSYVPLIGMEEPELPYWIITDVRLPNEYKSIRDKGGLIVYVHKESEDDVELDKDTEGRLDDFKFDYGFDNNGTIEELLEQVSTFCQIFELIK